MSRDSSGNYSLPSGNPVVTGTTVSSSTHNTTMTDVASEIENSLDRGGRGNMTVPFELLDGAVGAPSFTFISETTSGVYRAATNDIRMSIAGTDHTHWESTGLKVAPDGPHSFGSELAHSQFTLAGSYTGDGSSTVAYAMVINTSLTGATGDTTRQAGLALVADITTQGQTETVGLVSQLFVDEPAITVGTGDTVTLASTVYISNAPTEATTNYALYVAAGASAFPAGSVGAPSVTFLTDPESGPYSPGGNIYAITCGGTEMSRLDGTGNGQLLANNQTNIATPFYSFLSDTGTGVGRVSAGAIGFSLSGTHQWTMSSNDIKGTTTGAPNFANVAASLTQVNIAPRNDDLNTGLGGSGSDVLTLITGGVTAVTIDASQDITFASNLSVSGSVLSTNNTGGLNLSGNTSDSAGANIFLNGSANTGVESDWGIRVGTTNIVDYDSSSGELNLNPTRVDLGGSTGLTLGANVFRRDKIGSVSISGDTGSNSGGSIVVYGENHATQGDDFELKSDTNTIVQYDASATSLILATGSTTALTIGADQSTTFAGPPVLGSSELTISSGAVTVTKGFHTITSEGGSGVADALTAINGGVAGSLLILGSSDTTSDITVTDGATIRLAGSADFVLSNTDDRIVLHCISANNWAELSRSDNTT
jgi:hypothetical protein